MAEPDSRADAPVTTPPQHVDRAGLERLLAEWGIDVECVDHAPVLTMEESSHLHLALSGSRCKNLLLKEKKGRTFLLVTVPEQGAVDLVALRAELGCKRLSFADHSLMDSLGVPPGGMSPLALVNDTTHSIHVLLDQRLHDDETLLLHPLDNAASLRITPAQLAEFFGHVGADVTWVEVTDRPAA